MEEIILNFFEKTLDIRRNLEYNSIMNGIKDLEPVHNLPENNSIKVFLSGISKILLSIRLILLEDSLYLNPTSRSTVRSKIKISQKTAAQKRRLFRMIAALHLWRQDI
jgi:hypothetical protein